MGNLRVGVVGVGKMGEYHVGILSELMEAEVAAVVDVSEDRGREIAKRYGTSYFGENQDLLGKVDAVVVAVPTSLHYQVAKEFLTAGIHVLLEKPCANNLDQARELFAIASEKNLTLHIGHVERFNGAVQELHKIVSDPIYVECKRMGAFSERVSARCVTEWHP